MKLLAWLASGVLLVMLMYGIGLLVAFVLDGTTVVGAVLGASLTVTAWHGLRRLEPRHAEDRPEDGWPVAVVGAAACGALLLLGLWNPWLLLLGWIVFPAWLRATRRPEDGP
ncbi:MAG TPA: hypothetical protein VGF25_13835 [Thermoleophilaceae bacterium]